MWYKGVATIMMECDSEKDAERIVRDGLYEMTNSLCVDSVNWFVEEIPE